MSDASEDRIRFQVELEFVQCLGNPNYLNFLAQRGYFKDQAFVNYLKYLLYWKEPQYAHFLKYPMCLYFLDQLQYEHFRRELASAQCAKFIDDQQVLLWQHYTKRRTRLLQEHTETPSNTPSNASSNNTIASTNTNTTTTTTTTSTTTTTTAVPVSNSSTTTTSNNNTSSNSNSCSSSSNSNSNTSCTSNTTTNSAPRPQQTNGQSTQNPT